MIFDRDLQDEPFEDELPVVEFKNQLSTLYTNGRITPLPSWTTPTPFANSLENSFTDFETSLDRQLYKINAGMIKKGMIGYLRYCTNKTIDEERIFENGNLFCYEIEENSYTVREGLMEMLISNNEILSPWGKKELVEVFRQYPELKGLFREIKEIFGKYLTEELVYLLEALLQKKKAKFQIMEQCEIDDLVPKMERFWGNDNDEEVIKGGWCVYNDLDYERVKKLATGEIETLGSTFYFSKKLKYLVLSSINSEVITEVNLLDKFTSFVSFVSSTLFLTMAGICQKEQDLQEFLSDLRFRTEEDGKLAEEHLAKRVKSQ